MSRPTPSSTPAPTEAETKSRILEAAERVIAEKGFDKTTLRDITREAGANLASVNYYFGSRDALIDALIVRYVLPVNEQRLQHLDALEAEHAGDPVPLQKILEAFTKPILARAAPGSQSEQLFFKMLGRCMSERSYRLPEEVLPSFHDMTVRFSRAVRRVLPHLSEEVILWRLQFTFGALAHTLVHSENMFQLTNGHSGTPDGRQLLELLNDFCLAGLESAAREAPPAPPTCPLQ